MRHEDTQVTSSYDWLTDLRDQNPCGDSWYRTDDGDIVNGCLTCGERADCAMKATEDRLTAFIGRLEN